MKVVEAQAKLLYYSLTRNRIRQSAGALHHSLIGRSDECVLIVILSLQSAKDVLLEVVTAFNICSK